MALEIRPCREDELPAMHRIAAIVFGNYQGRDTPNPGGMAPEWTLCAFEDGELATSYAAFPFQMRLNGAKAPAAGVTFVGTLPWYRRRGHLRQIIEKDLRRRYEERREPIAILLASIAGIYQRYGYAVVSERYRYSIDPRWIAFAPSLPRATGTWREVSSDDLPLLERIYRQFSSPRNGLLHRAPVMWERMVMAAGGSLSPAPEFGPAVLCVYEERGEPQAYVAWSAREFQQAPDGAGPGQRVLVRDRAWLTPSAYRACWEFFANFDLARRIVIEQAPVDDPAFDVLLNPRELNAWKGDWLLGRVIDVERALPLRPYGATGRVVFEVQDELCPWNAGRWALDAGPEGAAVSRASDLPQLSMHISALAQLLFGHLSPTRAVRAGRAEAAPDAPLELWDAMWRTDYAPFCPDQF